MKNLIIFLFVLSAFSFKPKSEVFGYSHWNNEYTYDYVPMFAIPNAVGDGVADDTLAIQAWLDSGSASIPNGNEIYRITSTIQIDQPGFQIAEFNGATIISTTETTMMLNVNKPSGEFLVQNLNVDGRNIADSGFIIFSPTSGFNLSLKNLNSDGSRAVPIRIDIDDDGNSFGTYDFFNTDIDNINSVGDGVIGTVDGIARAVWVRWNENKTNTTIRFIGGSWSNIWGDDGDHIQVDGNDQTTGSTSETQFIGLTLTNSNRRILKGTAYNIGLYSCVLEAPPADHPEVLRTPQTAMIAFGMIGDGVSSLGYGHKLINCTVIGTGGSSAFARVTNTKTTDMVINGNTFYDMTIAFDQFNSTHDVSGVQIINNTCYNTDLRSSPSYGTNRVGIANNIGLVNSMSAGDYYTISSPDALISCSNGIKDGSETGVDSGGACDISATSNEVEPTATLREAATRRYYGNRTTN